MSAVGRTTQFPRIDNIFKKKESIPFDESQSIIWQERPYKGVHDHIIEWFIYWLIGVSVGIVAFVMKLMEEHLIHFVTHWMEGTQPPEAVGTSKVAIGWLIFAGMSGLYGLLGGILTTYFG